MPFILLILLLFSATCSAYATEFDSVAIALQGIPKDSLMRENGKAFSIPYEYDKNKTLYIDVQNKTVKLINQHNQVIAEGPFKYPDNFSKTLLREGHWRYYYSNGKLKQEGNYIIAPYTWVDNVAVKDAATGKKIKQAKKVLQYQSLRNGTWKYYNREGALVDVKDFY